MVEFVRAGAAAAVGLELAPTAQREAAAYLADTLTPAELANAEVRRTQVHCWPQLPAEAYRGSCVSCRKRPTACRHNTQAALLPHWPPPSLHPQVHTGDFFKWEHPTHAAWDVAYGARLPCSAVRPGLGVGCVEALASCRLLCLVEGGTTAKGG